MTAPETTALASDDVHMARAIGLGGGARTLAPPNPWVGAVVVTATARAFEGATSAPGGPHAEIVAINSAATVGADLAGATLYVTLEPCGHHGRTPPCVDAIVAAGIGRVVIGLEDPDPQVDGRGVRRLRESGVDVEVGVLAEQVERQLLPYLKHRRTGRPWVVLKLAATIDGRTAAPDGTSQWITGPEARTDAHRLRAESDAVIVGAGTVRVDDPALTVRLVDGRDPLRVVVGQAPPDARIHPALELDGPLTDVLDELGRRGVVQALVEGGAGVAGRFHRDGLVDRYVLYLAPALFGGEDAQGLFAGAGAASIDDVWRGRIVHVERLGDDLKVEIEPHGGGGSRS
ncbi:MAG: bifunctional diaminohydroxyphosphoribosylaminopyrimidine deaminase/5-amino-6-(5-phosphoribosylamino)uracil reductase RibD [Acidimicrobiales bacterium]